jgi:hypothetical protein
MIKTVTEANVRRAQDGSHGRQPLRLQIARRRARTHAGREKFVTQVRMGDGSAVVVPWREDRAREDRARDDRAREDRTRDDRAREDRAPELAA